MTEKKKDEREIEKSIDKLTDVEGHAADDDEGDQDWVVTVTTGTCTG